MKVLWTLVVVALVGCGLLAIIIFTGAYNVAASDAHTAPVRWMLATARVNAVQARVAEDATVPPGLGEAATVEAGAKLYDRLCAACHGSPAEKAQPWAAHMMPAPPDMPHVAAFWEPQEIYWIVEHGFKMTGMPAWGPLLTPEEIWQVVAFIEAYDQTSVEDYRAVTAVP